jgi:hypothetical protein
MNAMRKHSPAAREDGFQTLRPYAADHVDELLAELNLSVNDHGLTCWLLELLGEARSEKALPALTAYLYSTDESFRSWAVAGLPKLNTRAARTELWKARSNQPDR